VRRAEAFRDSGLEPAQAAAPPAGQADKSEERSPDTAVERKAAVAQPAAAAAAPSPQLTGRAAEAEGQAAAGDARARRAADVAALAGATRALRDAAGEARITVQSRDGRWRWRVGRALEYSSDDGVTWRPSAGPTAAQSADILAGTSPLPPVAWLVGRRGLVLVSDDGLRFERRGTPAAADLVAVQATDGSSAVVRAATGASWRTVDGGRTWAALPRAP
jgi:hypothetical protein